MKRILPVILALTVLLTGCTKEPDGYKEAAEATRFKKISTKDQNSLQHPEAIEKVATDSVLEIGATSFSDIKIGNFDSAGSTMQFIHLLGQTEDRWLHLRMNYSYSDEQWEVTDIENAITGKYYKVNPNSVSIPDLYDYTTGELSTEVVEQSDFAKSLLAELKDPKNQIDTSVRSWSDQYSLTSVDSIDVNDNASIPGTYVVIIRYTFDADNKDLIKQYSDDIAARIGKEYNNVGEVSVFWSGSKLSGTCKRSYAKAPDGMKLSDQAGF